VPELRYAQDINFASWAEQYLYAYSTGSATGIMCPDFGWIFRFLYMTLEGPQIIKSLLQDCYTHTTNWLLSETHWIQFLSRAPIAGYLSWFLFSGKINQVIYPVIPMDDYTFSSYYQKSTIQLQNSICGLSIVLRSGYKLYYSPQAFMWYLQLYQRYILCGFITFLFFPQLLLIQNLTLKASMQNNGFCSNEYRHCEDTLFLYCPNLIV
jgi:hypothetical protein